MKQITQQEWESIPANYKGEWTEGIAAFRGDIPKEYIGKKTMLDYNETSGTVLLTEGIGFEIIN